MAALDTAARETGGRWKPYPEYRDSGLDWLGEIPEGWRETRLAHLGAIVGGMTPATGEATYWYGDVPWVSPKDMKRPVIDSSEDTITEQAVTETGLTMIEPPAVLFVARGMILAHSFPVAVTAVPVTVNQDMKALRLRADIEPDFVRYLFGGIASAVVNLLVEESGHGTKALRLDRWRRFPLFIPPIEEQRAIVAFLDRETARIDTLAGTGVQLAEPLGLMGRQMAFLSEYRAALVNAAVTGKIDVREEVAA